MKQLVKEGVLVSDSFEAIRDSVAGALQNQLRVETNDADCYCWIVNLYSDRVVYSSDGKYYLRTYSADADGNISFGDATQVEASWEADAGPAAPGKAAQRVPVFEALQFNEGYDEATGEATITVIQPGFNKSKGRYYPAATLKRDYKIFEGAKMFVDHATDAQVEARPEGSVHDWVASIKKVWAEADGRVRAKIAVFHEGFRKRLADLKAHNLLTDMGVSIRAIGEGDRREVEGVETTYVESLLSARSVDFVTFAGAGGMVEALESAAVTTDVDLVSEAVLRERRPELVKLIETKSEEKALKTVEQRLQEAEAALTKATSDLAESNTKLAEAEKAQKKTAAASELARLLLESKLPEAAKKRLQKQFAEAETTKDMKEAIDLEVEYLKSVGAGAPKPAVVKNNGAQENTQESGDEHEPTEAERAARHKEMKESYMSLGMSEAAAEVAAAGRK